jgi:predicted dehydrogenase
MYVGYNLRFSGVALAAREFVTANEIVAADFQVASYLPNWRSNVEYRKSSSAREATGGGVLRDLSHELDLASWLLGSMEIEHSYSDKLSDLEIETDDYFEGMFESINGARVNLRLSSFSKIPSRTFRLLSKSNCFVGDFGTNQYRIGDEVISLNESVDDSYLRMHRAVLSNDKSVLCTASEAYMIVDLIARCRQAAPKTSS